MLAFFLAVLAILTVPISIKISEILSKYNLSRNASTFGECRDPPSERPYDYFGIVKIISSTRHLLKKTALANTIDLFERYGDTYASRILTQKVFFTCEPRNIKHVLVTRFVDYDSSTVRDHLFRPITEHGIFAVDGPEWRVARDLYRNVFSNTRSIMNIPMQEYHFQRFIRQIPPAGKTFDLHTLFLNLTLDITTSFALGESVDSLSPDQSEEKKQFVAALFYVKKTMARDGFLGPVHVLLSKRGFHKACGDVHRYVERAIAKALEEKRQDGHLTLGDGGPQGYSLLYSLVKDTDDVLALRDGVITILIAGIDSVASLLSTTFWLLARDQRVFQKLRANILDTIGHDAPTFDQLKSLTFLRHVFNEAMRVYPPVPFNARTTNKDTTLPSGGGADGRSSIHVKKGQRVVFSSWASHRSFKTFGDDAHDFRPERWESMKAEALGFVPFNLGPRACPGQQYALMEASYATVRILQTFSDIRNCDPRPWSERIGLNLSNDNGVIVEAIK